MAQAVIHESVCSTRKVPWIPIAWFAALLAILFARTIYGMVHEWFALEEMGHGIFVPFVAGYIAWQDREALLNQPVKPSGWGIPVLLWGFLQLLLGYLGADYFLARSALLICIAGVILACCGTAMLRRLAFPLFILVFMLRIPGLIYSQVTFPLQLFASRVAEVALMALDIPVLREGNVLELPSQKLSVVEACSGIRSLISLVFLAIVYGYLFDRRPWMKWVLMVLAVPIAIAANSMRVTITGILSEYNTELAEGIYHTMEGWIIFMLALVMLVACHGFLAAVFRSRHAEV